MTAEIRTVSATWLGELAFRGENTRGGELQIGTLADQPGVSPMELLLLGLAGCTGMDVVNILRKKRQSLSDLRVNVRGKRAEEHPKVYTEIQVEYVIAGEDLDPKAVRQAIELSEEKYCSASAMLGVTAKITSSYQINPQPEIQS